MQYYAKYNGTDWLAKVIGAKWYKVTAEYTERRPSGLQKIIVINGHAVKEKLCTIIQVF